MDNIAQDILRHIFSYLDVNSCHNSMLVCKKWADLIINPRLICLDQINFKIISRNIKKSFSNEKNSFLQKYIEHFDILILLKNQPYLCIHDEQKLCECYINAVKNINKQCNKLYDDENMTNKKHTMNTMFNKIGIELSIETLFKTISTVNYGKFNNEFLEQIIDHFDPKLYNTIIKNTKIYNVLSENKLLTMLDELSHIDINNKSLDNHISPYYASRKFSAFFYYSYTLNRYKYYAVMNKKITFQNLLMNHDILSALDPNEFIKYINLIKNDNNIGTEKQKIYLINVIIFRYYTKHGNEITKNIKLDEHITLNHIANTSKNILSVFMEYNLGSNNIIIDKIMEKIDIIDIYNCNALKPEQKEYYIDKKRNNDSNDQRKKFLIEKFDKIKSKKQN